MNRRSSQLTAVKEAEEKIVIANLKSVAVAEKMFVLYKNLLSENAQTKWDTIVDSQIGANPWTDLGGKVHDQSQVPLVQSFKDCVTFHLLTVFPQDTAEKERYYVNVHLKITRRFLIRHFVS